MIMSAPAILLEASLSDLFGGFWQGVRLLLTKLFQAGQAGCQWLQETLRLWHNSPQLPTSPQFFTQSWKIQLSSIFCSCLCKPHQNFSLQADRYNAIAVCIIKVGCFLLISLWIYSLFCENNQSRSSRECTYRTSQSLANTFWVLNTMKTKLRYVISYMYMCKTRRLSQTEAPFSPPWTICTKCH